MAAVPDAAVTGTVGRSTSFEVVVNGTEIHSKLKTMGFPDFPEVVSIVTETAKGASPVTVQKTQSNCVIL